ncbi:MAG: 30S ribosomal protein S6, partial [Desulfuromonadales bacterium]|nr:30S ribosomal protein S6 [Desulfuromonadales bacterium]
MRTYESIYIVHPDIVGDAYAASVEKFKKILTDMGVNILKTEEWGTRKLAYPVKKQTRGSFVLTAFEADAPVIAEFERRLRIDESIIKFQAVHLEKGLQMPVPVKDEAAASAKEEPIGSESE